MNKTKEAIDKTHQLTTKIEELKAMKKKYDEMLGESRYLSFNSVGKASTKFSALYISYFNYKNGKNDSFSFKDYWVLYNTIKYLINKNKEDEYLKSNIDLDDIKRELENSSEKLSRYVIIKFLIQKNERELDELIDNFSFDDTPCIGLNHALIELDGELKCVCCDHKIETKTQEDHDFYKLIAQRKGILIKDATKEDLPFIQRIVKKAKLTYEEYIDNFFESKDEEDIEEIPIDIPAEIKSDLIEAHNLDSNTYKNVIVKTKLYNEEEKKPLLEIIEKDIKRAESLSDEVKTKDLIVEMCKTIKYEILILSGSHIPTLYEEATNEDKIAVAKAFYNISNTAYRKASGYFKDEISAALFTCNTAHYGINNEIINREIIRPKTKSKRNDNKQ